MVGTWLVHSQDVPTHEILRIGNFVGSALFHCSWPNTVELCQNWKRNVEGNHEVCFPDNLPSGKRPNTHRSPRRHPNRCEFDYAKRFANDLLMHNFWGSKNDKLELSIEKLRRSETPNM